MKKVLGLVGATLLFSGQALAADLPVKAPAAPLAAAPFSWTGFYIGAHVGAGWGTKEWDQNLFLPATETAAAVRGVADSSHTVNGILGGVQAGVNYQFTPFWVVGVEAQFSGADLKGRGNCGFSGDFNCSSKVDEILTVAGRFGLTWDRVLVYVKGGGAWTHDKFDFNLLGFAPSSVSDSRSGFMVGTGVELAISNNWSAKMEYNYMDLGTKSYTFATLAPFNHFDITERLHLVKFGINYRFGSW